MAVAQLPEKKLRDPQRNLPTMYDLPSEDPEESGLPDEFHVYQPQLLRESFQSPLKERRRVFIGTDINLYYDPEHTLWYKKPDWFLVIDTPRFYRDQDLRMSYVVWDEPAKPYLVVELLSPDTEDEDFGTATRVKDDGPPGKWEVYERILKIPYYVIYNRYANVLHAFQLVEGRYRSQEIRGNRYWLPEIALGLGLWTGEYDGSKRTWLRWCDAEGRWLTTPAEREHTQFQRAEQERQRAEQEREHAELQRQRAEQADQRAAEEQRRAEQERERAEREHDQVVRLIERLKALGINPEEDADQ